ncbi:peroxiredoxin [Candidatus Azambacteria bacterium]|nr:peroxiredoxin [Candidatus Azambacteria bacterium]MBI2587728.1 peroxiredoxin [Candidatus Azambacteria bacterium]
MVKIGELFPVFSLKAWGRNGIQDIKIDQYRGKWLVLFWYPADFTFVCPTEVRGFHERYSEFQQASAEVLGASVDSVWSHKAWIEKEWGSLAFPLLADANREVIKLLGIDTEGDDGRVALRATFIIDPEGKLRYQVVSDNNVGRSVEETLRVLKALQTGGLCPIEWKPGEELLKGH